MSEEEFLKHFLYVLDHGGKINKDLIPTINL
jgi:hypothetical protein